MKKFALIFILSSLSLSWAALLSEKELRQAASAWLADKQIFAQGAESFAVDSMEPVYSSDGDALPLYVLQLNPTGYLLLSADNTLPPVLAFSLHGKSENISRRQATPFLALLRRQGQKYQQLLAEPQLRGESRQQNTAEWQRLLTTGRRADPAEIPAKIIREPLVKQAWGQGWPYNLYLPRSAEEIPAITGCEPTAVALIMNFHQWPPRGKGSKNAVLSVAAEGDVPGTLRANFSFPYNWPLMLDVYSKLYSPPTASELAVAGLMFDLGVAFESTFNVEETGTSSDKAVPAMEKYFAYSGLTQGKAKESPTKLFQRIKEDVLAGYPVRATIPGHAFVLSGLANIDGGDYYYLNYGWDGYLSGWYRLDDGDDGEVVDSAITNFLPAKKAIFQEIPLEQGTGFTLRWDFPWIHTAAAFRLSVKRNGVTSEIPSTIDGGEREYQLSGQPEGRAEYFLEAKVGDEWHGLSDPLAVNIVKKPAAAPEFTLAEELFFLRADGTFLLNLQLQDAAAELLVSCSRPDLYPAQNIRISGEGNQREIRLLPADNIVGANAMLWLTAKNANNMTYNRTVSLLWQKLNWLDNLKDAEALAEAQGKKIFLIIGLDGDDYTLQLHQYYCQISDIAAALQDDYILCYLQSPDQVDKVFGLGSFSLPLTAILQQEGQDWQAIFRHNPWSDGRLSPTGLRTALVADPLQLRPAVQEFDFQARTLFVQVLAQGDWTISSDSDFLQVTRSSGGGRATLECVLLENFGEKDRVAKLTLSSGAALSSCQIQQGYDPPQEISIPKGWNTLTLSVKLNAQSQQLCSTQLHIFECHNRVFARVSEPQPGTAYLVYNGTDAEITLSGRKMTGTAMELPTTSGIFLQGIEENRELPSGTSAWLLLESIYLPVLDGQLEAGKAYWLYR